MIIMPFWHCVNIFLCHFGIAAIYPFKKDVFIMLETLGERIAHLRKSKKMSQADLMKALNIHQLSRFENNQREPNIATLISIAQFFGVSLDWLLTGEDTNKIMTDKESYILKLFNQLDLLDQAKIEGILEYKVSESTNQKQTSSLSPEPGSTNLLA